ncbi:hypothetical protein J437_LFUL010466 [Ladona fulva]|uniref:Integrase catalytic domain-containing protein n=1 Tax=Ladona fulva TaxID=123851 RepID=A0A8K0P7T5_LADFU|nr:hypothetical protein J437_LFUL010466 [Ladona fulva]
MEGTLYRWELDTSVDINKTDQSNDGYMERKSWFNNSAEVELYETTNANYIVVVKNPRDRLQFGHLARRVYPENSQELKRVYRESTKEPIGCFVLDLGQDTDDRFRFRTKIFPEDERTTVFMHSRSKIYTTNNPDIKASIVERSNRTLKTKMYKYFTKYSTYNYVDVLPKLVSGCNNSIHSTTGIQPYKVTEKNGFVITSQLQMKTRAKKKVTFNVGDYVRISKESLPFATGYTPNYTSEIFSVVSIDRTRQVPTYKLQDMNGENIKGNFYAKELLPAEGRSRNSSSATTLGWWFSELKTSLILLPAMDADFVQRSTHENMDTSSTGTIDPAYQQYETWYQVHAVNHTWNGTIGYNYKKSSHIHDSEEAIHYLTFISKSAPDSRLISSSSPPVLELGDEFPLLSSSANFTTSLLSDT